MRLHPCSSILLSLTLGAPLLGAGCADPCKAGNKRQTDGNCAPASAFDSGLPDFDSGLFPFDKPNYYSGLGCTTF